MGADLFDVRVAEASDTEAVFALTPLGPSSTVAAGPGFAMMLLADEGAPGAAAYRAWLDACDDDMDPDEFLYRVEACHRDGVVEIRVCCSEPGPLSHLEPGQRWGSTAYDERGDGLPLVAGRAVWTRPAPIPKVNLDAGFQYVGRRGDVVEIDIFTANELPAPDPAVWFSLLRYDDPVMSRRKVHEPVTRYVAEVSLVEVEGERTPDARIRLGNDLQLRTHGVLRARYRLVLGTADAMPDTPGRCWVFSWPPDQVLIALSAGSTSLAEFHELVDLGAEDGPEAQLEMLIDGLDEGAEVVRAALDGLTELGPAAASAGPAIRRLVGCSDGEVARAALRAAHAIGALDDATRTYAAVRLAAIPGG